MEACGAVMVTMRDYSAAWRGSPVAHPTTDCDPAVRTLGSLARLSPEEIRLIAGLRRRPQTFQPGQEICHAEEFNPKASIIAEGWAARVRMLPDGRRQILMVLLPGDCIAVASERGALNRPALIALTRVALLDATPLREHLQEPAGAAGALVQACAATEDEMCQMLVDQVVRLGRHSTYERVLDFFDELHRRQRRAGLASADRMPLPLTQDVLSDVLGVSLVHVNRTLQAMRREGVLTIHRGHVEFRKPAGEHDPQARRGMSFQPASHDRAAPPAAPASTGVAGPAARIAPEASILLRN